MSEPTDPRIASTDHARQGLEGPRWKGQGSAGLCIVGGGIIALAGAVAIGLGCVANATQNRAGADAEEIGSFLLFTAFAVLAAGFVAWLKEK